MLLAELIEHWRWGATALIFPLSKWGLKKRDEYVALHKGFQNLEKKFNAHAEENKTSTSLTNEKLDKILSQMSEVKSATDVNSALLNDRVRRGGD